jgi:sugar phosphate isomerase/epimerase
MTRRSAIAVLASSAIAVRRLHAATVGMKMCLNVGNIGVKATLPETVALAAKYGFQAVDPKLPDLTALSDAAQAQLFNDMREKKLEFGSIFQGVPNQPDLAAAAKTLERAQVTRFTTWINSTDNRLTYLQNFKLLTKRFGDAATVFGDHGIRFGLEYVGPKTSWARGKYPFIHNIETLKELIAEINKPNVGFCLDSWHWYASSETAADLLTLKKEQIVSVHLNDAPAGIPVDQQNDSVRALPASTGVIDTAAFLGSLQKLGYDGPVTAEPFDAELRKLPPEEALTKTAQAMKKAFGLIAAG